MFEQFFNLSPIFFSQNNINNELFQTSDEEQINLKTNAFIISSFDSESMLIDNSKQVELFSLIKMKMFLS
jgi:hypothetical protein